jgi:hypothetical protein
MGEIERIIIDTNSGKASYMNAVNGLVIQPVKILDFSTLTNDEMTIIQAAISIIKSNAG